MATKPNTKKAADDKVIVSVYLNGSTVAALDEAARKEDRSRNYIMERALKRDLLKDGVAA